jgi:hypothetical protein
MSGSFCPARCRWLVRLRSGAARCSRWTKGKEPMAQLVQAREDDPYGEPQWIPREGCDGIERKQASGR